MAGAPATRLKHEINLDLEAMWEPVFHRRNAVREKINHSPVPVYGKVYHFSF